MEGAIRSAARVDGSTVSQIVGYRSRRDRQRDQGTIQQLESLVDTANRHLYRIQYDVTLHSGWVNRSQNLIASQNESWAHVRGKHAMAQFLDGLCHEFPRCENPYELPEYKKQATKTRDWLYSGGFEQAAPHGIADIACLYDSCELYGEVGTVSATKLLHNISTSPAGCWVVAPYRGMETGPAPDPDTYTFYVFTGSEATVLDALGCPSGGLPDELAAAFEGV